MKNKNITQIKKELRRHHERAALVIVALSTVLGTAAISTDARRVLSGLAMRPAYAVVKHLSKECETARHPVHLGAGYRTPLIGGE